MGPEDAIKDVPVPALVMGAGTLCALLLCALLVRRPGARGAAVQKWGGIVGAWWAFAGYTIAHARIVGRGFMSPSWSMPTEHWAVYAGLCGALLTTCESLWRAPAWARWTARATLAGLVSAALLTPLMRSHALEWFVWGSRDAGVWLVGGALGVVWIMSCMVVLAHRPPAWSAWLTMSVMLGAMAPSLAFWGVAQGARLMGVLAAMSGAVFLVCAAARFKRFGAPIALALGALAGALSLHAASATDVEPAWLGVFLLTPIAWAAADLPVFNRLGKGGRIALRAVLPALVGGVAAWMAYNPSEYAGL